MDHEEINIDEGAGVQDCVASEAKTPDRRKG